MQVLEALSTRTCHQNRLPVNTLLFEAKQLLIKIMTPVKGSSCVEKEPSNGTVGVLNLIYLTMKNNGQCAVFLATGKCVL